VTAEKSSRRRRWLVLSHSFNMDGRAASLTVTDKLKYLEAAGIDVTILRAVTGDQDAHYEHIQLLPWGPSGLRFDFRHLVAKRFGRGVVYRPLTVGFSILMLPFIILERLLFGLTHHSSWTLPAAHRGTKLVQQGDFELVFSSGGGWSAHKAASIIKKRTGIKWIAEIHDPMVIRDDEEDTGRSPRESRNLRYLQSLEKTICEEADHIWWFTESAKEYARKRHPALGERGFHVLPGVEQPETKGVYQRQNKLRICHFGSLTDDRSLAPVIRSISELVKVNPEMRKDLELHIYGSNLDQNAVSALQETDLDDLVIRHGRLEFDPVTRMSGRARVTQRMFESDVLLLLHGDYEWCAEYIPSKYYEYLWAKRPVLALTNRNPEFDSMLAARNSYICKTLQPESISETIMTIWQDWKSDALRPVKGEPVTVASAVQDILHELKTDA
jgi:hypothetical protein